jgi:hypothetical protein
MRHGDQIEHASPLRGRRAGHPKMPSPPKMSCPRGAPMAERAAPAARAMCARPHTLPSLPCVPSLPSGPCQNCYTTARAMRSLHAVWGSPSWIEGILGSEGILGRSARRFRKQAQYDDHEFPGRAGAGISGHLRGHLSTPRGHLRRASVHRGPRDRSQPCAGRGAFAQGLAAAIDEGAARFWKRDP